MTLKSFPRGGRKPQKNIPSNNDSKKKSRSKFRSKNADFVNTENENTEVSNLLSKTADCLTYSTLTQGMVVLGRVRESRDYDLIISLPGRLIGRLQLTDISESYTKLLQSMIDVQNDKPDGYKPLPELFKPGDYLTCYVKQLNPQDKWQVSLSLEPELINQNLDRTRIIKRTKVVGSISSVEEHGYVIDTGVANLRTFLASKDVDKEVQYYVGQQLSLMIKDVKTSDSASTITVSAKTKHNSKAVEYDKQLLDALIPGAKLVLVITKVLSTGLQVSFNENNIGYVNQIYLDKPLSSYSADMSIHGTLLYILPTLKFAYFSLLSEESESDKLDIGEIINAASVVCREQKGILLRLPKNLRGFIPLRRTQVNFEKIVSKFAPDTKHKCRILNYDWFDRVYICSMEKEILNQKHLRPDSFSPGELITAKITKIDFQYGSVVLKVDKTNGYIPPEHVSDYGTNVIKSLEVGQSVEVRVLKNDSERNRVVFTMKRSLIESNLPILSNIEEAVVGSQHHGTVVQVKNTGILIQFFGDLKGWVPPHLLGCSSTDAQQVFSIGQVLPVKIVKVDKNGNKMSLSLENTVLKKERNFRVGDMIEGIVAETSPQGVHVNIKLTEQEMDTAFLPAGHMSPSLEVASLLAARLTPGDKITAIVFSIIPDLILTTTFAPHEELTNFEKLTVGHYLPCSVREIFKSSLKVLLPINDCKEFGVVPHVKTSDLESIYVNQMLFGKIINIDKAKKKIELTIDLYELWVDSVEQNAEMTNAVDVLALYLNKLEELSEYEYFSNKGITKASLGQRITGKVEKVTENGLVLDLENNLRGTVRKDQYKNNLKVGDKVSGTIIWINYIHEIVEVTLNPVAMNSIATKQTGSVSIPSETKLRAEIVLVTNWFILVVLKGQGKGRLAALPARRHLNDIEPDLQPYFIGAKVKCYVILDTPESSVVPVCLLSSTVESFRSGSSLKPNNIVKKRKKEDVSRESVPRKKAKLSQKESTEEFQDDEDTLSTDEDNLISKANKSDKQAVKNGKAVDESKKKKSKKLEREAVVEAAQQTRDGDRGQKDKKLKRKTAIESIQQTGDTGRIQKDKKLKREKVIEAVQETGDNDREQKVEELKNTEKEDLDGPKPSWKLGEKTTKKGLKINKVGIPECGFYWDTEPMPEEEILAESSSDSEEETESPQKQKKKKLSAAERKEHERQKEREIREREEALASNQTPNSIDQFDRLVMSSPDSSVVWVQYMAHHLQATEVEKARAVAKRAIKTINFREENEKLNVWQAWLNLESRFGTPETLNEVFQEALRTNDAFKVHTHMLTLHADAKRQTALEKTITTITGKFKQNPQAWIECGTALLKIGLKDKSRHIMQRALQSLPPHQHVDLMVRFAQLENRFGDKERAQTLFEKVLSSYPKRVDVWSAYVDALIKSGDVPIARQVLERATAQTLPARKMKTIFKKFIAFEEQHGTPENIANVQQMARDYVENQCQ